MPVRRHAVLGAGAVGTALALDLARSGARVRVLLRPDSIGAYGGRLTARSPVRDTVTADVPAATHLDRPVDALWVTVKAPHLDAALEQIDSDAPDLVISLINGLDHMDVLRRRFGIRAIAGAVWTDVRRGGTGEVVRESLFTEMDLSLPEPVALRAAWLVDQLTIAGIAVRVGAGDDEVLWRKLAQLAPLALATTAIGGPLARVRRNEPIDTLMKECAREACRGARSRGVPVQAEEIIRRLSALPGRLGSSLQRDEMSGPPLELDAIAGPVMRFAGYAPATAELVRLIRDKPS